MSGLCNDDLFAYLRHWYSNGAITKDEYLTTLRLHQNAVDAMKSSDRDEYETLKAEMELREAGRSTE